MQLTPTAKLATLHAMTEGDLPRPRSVRKSSYAVPCASAFRDALLRLADARGVNVGDLARSILLTVPEEILALSPDPGEPHPADREEVVLKSGPGAGRPWRRKPRLQVRLPDGHDVATIRRALGLALALAEGRVAPRLDGIGGAPRPEQRIAALESSLAEHREELGRLKASLTTLAFEPLPEGVQDRRDALYVMGFHPLAQPTEAELRARYRQRATIHHPDSPGGDHERMAQINAAVKLLRPVKR